MSLTKLTSITKLGAGFYCSRSELGSVLLNDEIKYSDSSLLSIKLHVIEWISGQMLGCPNSL